MLSSSIVELLKRLRSSPNNKVVVTVGNPLRSDDGVGPYISTQLESYKDLKVIDAGSTPENTIDEITQLKPELIMFIDAADFAKRPGECDIVEQDRIPVKSLSTHSISLKVIARILEEDTKAKIMFLGIQPASVGFGEGLSPKTKETADEIIKIFKGE